MAKNVTRSMVFQRPKSGSAPDALRTALNDASAKHMAMLVIASPRELGDTYAELVASLDLIAEADLLLQIVPPAHRPTE